MKRMRNIRGDLIITLRYRNAFLCKHWIVVCMNCVVETTWMFRGCFVQFLQHSASFLLLRKCLVRLWGSSQMRQSIKCYSIFVIWIYFHHAFLTLLPKCYSGLVVFFMMINIKDFNCSYVCLLPFGWRIHRLSFVYGIQAFIEFCFTWRSPKGMKLSHRYAPICHCTIWVFLGNSDKNLLSLFIHHMMQ